MAARQTCQPRLTRRVGEVVTQESAKLPCAGSIPARASKYDKIIIDIVGMYYVYTLSNKINSDLYIGSCQDLKLRFKEHNAGKNRSTKAYRPWILIYYEAYFSKTDALIREKHIKMHAVKNELKSRITNSLMGD